LGMQGLYLIEDDNYPSIVGRVWDIKGNDVEEHGSAVIYLSISSLSFFGLKAVKVGGFCRPVILF